MSTLAIASEPPGDAPAAPEVVAGSHRPRRRRIAPALLVFGLLALAPFFLPPAELSTLGRILYYALLAASLDLLVGITGLPSLAHAAWFGVGAYAAGLLARDVSALFVVQVGGAVIAAAVGAALTGWLAVRSRGIFFLMLTLAIGEIVFRLAGTADGVTGGSNGLYGIPAVELAPGGAAIVSAAGIYWYVAGGFTLGYLALSALARAPFGLALRGVRDNEERMRALGYATFRLKYAAFVLSGAVAGLAGALLVAQQRLVTPAEAGFTTAVLALLAVVIGGAGSLWGACVGAAVVVLVRDEVGPSLGGNGPLVLGLVFIACVYLLPRGIAGLTHDLAERRRRSR
jgi:branched-chain amino acid transport system permease protein